jgi:hypothetical protein
LAKIIWFGLAALRISLYGTTESLGELGVLKITDACFVKICNQTISQRFMRGISETEKDVLAT